VNNNWNDKLDKEKEKICFKTTDIEEYSQLFIKDIEKYLIDHRYIKINNKPVLGIYEPYDLTNIKETIKKFREKSKEFGIGDIFILACLNRNETNKIINSKLFDGAFDFPPKNSLGNFTIRFKNNL
jgi:hypothetical protein